MAKNLKVGDKVKIYGYDMNGRSFEGDWVHTVATPPDMGGYVSCELYLNPDEDCVVHQAQCRKLVKKPRREFWINRYTHDVPYVYNSKELADELAGSTRIDCIHVREVKKK